MPVQSFSPTTGYARLSTLAYPTVTPTINAVASAVTYSTAEFLSGFLMRNTLSSARADLLPKAASLCAAINGCQVGTAFRTWIRNTSAGAGSITLTPNTGATISGTAVIEFQQQQEFMIVFTSVIAGLEAYVAYSLGSTGSAGAAGPAGVGAFEVSVKQSPYNAVGDGTTDDTAAFQSAITAAKQANTRGATVRMPKGDYKISSTLIMDDVVGTRLVGEGGSSRFLWSGNATDALLRLSSANECQLADWSIQVSTVTPLAVGIHCYTRAGATYASRRNHFINLHLDGTTTGLGIGFKIGGSTGVDANNDFHTFTHCIVANYGNIGYSLENTQIYGLLFLNCLFQGFTGSQIGLATNQNAGKGGSFTWIGGGGSNNALTDFAFGDPNSGAITIRDGCFEASKRLLTTGGPSGSSFLLRLDGVRWSGDALHADTNMIDFRFPGPWAITNCRLSEYESLGPRISWNPGGGAGARAFIFTGNALQRNVGTSLWSGVAPTTLHDNIVNGAPL